MDLELMGSLIPNEILWVLKSLGGNHLCTLGDDIGLNIRQEKNQLLCYATTGYVDTILLNEDSFDFVAALVKYCEPFIGKVIDSHIFTYAPRSEHDKMSGLLRINKWCKDNLSTTEYELFMRLCD